MKKIQKTTTGKIKAAVAAAMLSVFGLAGCGQIEVAEGACNIKCDSSFRSAEALSRMVYMGGSVVYDSADSYSSQLGENAVVAVRISKVNKTNLGKTYSYSLSDNEYSLGYIEVSDVNEFNITFTYKQYDKASGNISNISNYSLGLNETADLNGDGNADVIYRKADSKDRRWLSFMDNILSDSAAMFSVIPSQYEGGNYPGGLVGINPEGRSVVTKYNMGNSSRAVISNLSYGDYILDSEANSCEMYVGSGITGRSARAIADEELTSVAPATEIGIEAFMFKANEFGGKYPVHQLIMKLGEKMSVTDCSAMTIQDATNYLNTVIARDSFISELLAGETSEAANEIRAQLNERPVSCEEEKILFNRHSLAMMYPELCPDYSVSSTSLAVVFPWMYVNFGEEEKLQKLRDEFTSARAAIASANNEYNDGYNAYLTEKGEIEKRFDEAFYDYDLAAIVGGIAANSAKKAGGAVASIFNQAHFSLRLGINGSFSIANANPKVELALGVLVSADVEDCATVNIATMSFFQKENIKSKTIEEFRKEFPETEMSDDDIWDKWGVSEKIVKQKFALDKWFFNFAEEDKRKNTCGFIEPTENSKRIHKQFQPVKPYPFVFTFDGRFDILLKVSAVAEFKDCYLGGIAVCGTRLTAGINWGFRDWYTLFGKKVAPKVTTFEFKPYGDAEPINECTYYCGRKTNDDKNLQYGGGAQVQLVPVLEGRFGVGVGGSAAGSSLDMTFGCTTTVSLPIGLYIGANYNEGLDKLIFVADGAAVLQVDVGADVQFTLDPPLIDPKSWRKSLYKDTAVKLQLGRFRLENDEFVVLEGPKSLK